MINIPAFEHLDVDGFGLYPGPDGAGGLHAQFADGLTLVIGANGLGKTTLVTLLYRMLSGPADISSLSSGEELGTRRLEAVGLPAHARGIFAARVADRAVGATATLRLTVGETRLSVKRQLSNLALVELLIDGAPSADLSEEHYQGTLIGMAGVGSFGDLLLMLRYLMFYFEDRRALVWDQSAQRQLLRMLFLPPDVAQTWTSLERSILVKDSELRNFQAVVGKEEKNLTKNLGLTQSATAWRAELQGLEALQETDRERLQQLGMQTADLDNGRQKARSSHLAADQERESRFRAVEEAKLLAIQARFPEQAATGRYILAHLMSEQDCLVCGTHVVEAAARYAKRIEDDQCVVCTTPLGKVDGIVEARELADERVARRAAALSEADRTLEGATAARVEAEALFDSHRKELARLEGTLADRGARIEAIVAALPPSEQAMREQRDDLSRLRGQLEIRKDILAQERRSFAEFVGERTLDLLGRSDDIVQFFGEYASGFLSEQVSLTWSSYRAKLGQSGELIEFPSFDLEMSGSDFGASVRRAGPNDVSESQREFIDLAFRMALMRAASADGSASLVIDTPESSLDAVFARRAAQILLRFAGGAGNRLLVTSNLVEGSLIPTLAKGISDLPDPRSRLIDLFAIAKPTAAVIEAQAEYQEARVRLLGPALS